MCIIAAAIFSSATLPARAVPTAQPYPEPPCGVDPQPPYPEAVATTVTQLLKGAEIAQGWIPAACTGWMPTGFKTVLVLAARFHHDGGTEELLSRFAAVSAWAAIRYWSVTDKAPRALLTNASALSGPETRLRRFDFMVEELRVGAELFLSQVDSRSAGAAIYRMRVLERSPTRVVINMENASPIRAFRMTLFNPGDLQAAYFFDKLQPGVWGYYSLTATRDSASVLAGGHEASFINRATALYEHFAGLPAFASSPATK